MTTNLLPEEFVVEKIVRAKKPWVLGAVAMIMVGLAVQHAMGSWYSYATSDSYRDANNKTWGSGKSKATAVSSRSSQLKSEDDKLKTELGHVNVLGGELVSGTTSRTQLMRVLSAISQVIPKDPRSQDIQVDPETLPFVDREEIFIDGFTQDQVEDLTQWFTEDVKLQFEEDLRELELVLGLRQPGEEAATTTAASEDPDAPQAKGWTIRLTGHHYVNSTARAEAGLPTGRAFIRESLLNNMLNKEVIVAGEAYLLQDLGIVKPTIMMASPPTPTMVPGAKPKEEEPAETNAMLDGDDMGGADEFRKMQDEMSSKMRSGMGKMGGSGGGAAAEVTDGVEATRTTFILMAAWMPKTEEEVKARKLARLEREKQAEEAAAAAAVGDGSTPPAEGG